MKIKADYANAPQWKELTVKSSLPEQLKCLDEIAHNMWWVWNYEARDLFRDLDPEIYHDVKHNPVMLLERLSYARKEQILNDKSLMKRVKDVYAQFRAYMDVKPDSKRPSVAYFCMEYGIHSALKIYSGGLGMLAGDYVKEASDSNVDMCAVGFLYRFGYFTQSLSIDGQQIANYETQNFSSLPIVRQLDKDGNPLVVDVPYTNYQVHAYVWCVNVGRVKLYLLDTDNEMNSDFDKPITHALYGGDWENRLKQEILLGIGGMLLLKKLGIKKDVYHCNEGHAALCNLQRLCDYIEEGMTFVAVIDIFLDAELLQQQHTADTEQNLLFQTVLPVSAIEGMGNRFVVVGVHLVIGVQQIEVDTSYIHSPHVGIYVIVHVRYLDHQRFTILVELAHNGQRTEVLGLVVSNLLTVHRQALCEVAETIEETDGAHVDVGVRSLLHIVTGQHTQTAAVDLQGRVETVFHAEIGHRRALGVRLHIHILAELRIDILDALHECFVFQDFLLAGIGEALKQHDGIVSDLMIDIDVQFTEQVACLVVPYPPEVVGNLVQALQFFRQGSLDGQYSPLGSISIVCFNLHIIICFVLFLQSLDTQFVEHGDEALVKALVSANTLGKGYIDDVVIAIAHHDIALALLDGFDGTDTGAAGQDAVAG